MKTNLPLLIFCLGSKVALSQSPGGVGTANLRGWFDGQVGITLTGGFVSAWTDRALVGNATQATAAERPAVTANSFNYNDALTFDGVNDNLDLIDRMSNAATGVSAYAVARQTGTGNDSWGSVLNGQANGPLWTGGGYGLVALNAGSTQHGFYVRDYNTKGVSFAVTNGAPFLISGDWNGTTANNVQAFKNGLSAGTVGYTPGSVGDNGSTWIGSGDGVNTDWCFYGNIAEVIIFNTGLSAVNNNKVMSYLAVKYGITLGINYTNSAGTTIFTTAAPYVNNIIGITRDDGSGLIQRQSKNDDDSVRIYISTLAASNSANAGTFIDDLSHVIIGADKGRLCSSPTTSAEIPAGFGINRRLDREWKVTNTNFAGTFSMDFKLNPCAIPGSVNIADLRLLIDDDGNFAAGTTTAVASGAGGITISYANPVITVSGISTGLIAAGATKFITIGSVNGATPLPIKLTKFEADACGNKDKVCIDWTTASEKNGDFFIVQRSQDALNWEDIGSVKCKGNAAVGGTYTFQDNKPLKDVGYYRLSTIYLDNTSDFSPVAVVKTVPESEIKFVIYPNPNQGEFTADISGVENNHEVVVSLQDLGGKEVYRSKFFILDQNGTKFNIIPETKLHPGVYMCSLEIEGVAFKVKVVVN